MRRCYGGFIGGPRGTGENVSEVVPSATNDDADCGRLLLCMCSNAMVKTALSVVSFHRTALDTVLGIAF